MISARPHRLPTWRRSMLGPDLGWVAAPAWAWRPAEQLLLCGDKNAAESSPDA